MKSYKLYELGKIVTGYTPSTKNEDNYSSNDHMFIITYLTSIIWISIEVTQKFIDFLISHHKQNPSS